MKRLTTALLACLPLSSALLAGPADFTADGRALRTSHAVAEFTDEFFGGQTLALKIVYTPQPNNLESAVLVLFIDKDNHLWQVNLTVVHTGMTLGATIASLPEELAKFSQFSFDGQRLKLRSKGTFKSTDANFPANFSWDVNDDLPVVDIRKKKKS